MYIRRSKDKLGVFVGQILGACIEGFRWNLVQQASGRSLEDMASQQTTMKIVGNIINYVEFENMDLDDSW